LASEEAADIVLAAGTHDTVANDAAHSTSCVSTLDDAEGNMNTGPRDKKDEEEETALNDAERKIKTVKADKTSDEVESSAPDIMYAAVAVSSRKFAMPESSTAVAAPKIMSVQKKGVSVLGSFCMSSYMI
jgi:hypothetical protein